MGNSIRRILVLMANPKDTTPLRLDEEVREISEGLRRANKRDQFALEQRWAVRPSDIRRAMLDCKPQIVHFSGHGAGDAGIHLEDESGQSRLVTAEALACLFELFPAVECVLLNACYSDIQAESISYHVNFVVGIHQEISEKAALEFSVAFYDALGAGESIEFAYRLGCNSIQMAGIPGHLKPILKIRSGEYRAYSQAVLLLEHPSSNPKIDSNIHNKEQSYQPNSELQPIRRSVAVQNYSEYISEIVYSTLLPVLKMPDYVYGVSCQYNDTQEREAAKEIIFPHEGNDLCPFIIRGGMLYCFHNLKYEGGPFRKLVDGQTVMRYKTCDWWGDPDRMRWFVSLLNRSLNKLTGRKGLHLDKKHHRYYFAPEEPGKPLEVTYRPLNDSSATRQVVWQPITKKTGKPKPYWFHRAVALKFHRVSHQRWCLSIRPEMRITKDGIIPLESEKIGSKVTRKMSRMFNYDLLGEIQFWRDFLSSSQPRIILRFDRKQHILISTTLMQAKIEWPGMPEECQKSFKNADYRDDLFSLFALTQLEDDYLGEHSIEDDDWDIEEEEES